MTRRRMRVRRLVYLRPWAWNVYQILPLAWVWRLLASMPCAADGWTEP